MKDHKSKLLWRITAACLIPFELLAVVPAPWIVATLLMSEGPVSASSAVPASSQKQAGISIVHGQRDSLPKTPELSKQPTDAEIFGLHVFENPLIPIGSTTPGDNEAVGKAVTQFCASRHLEGLECLQTFVNENPGSPWLASIELNLGAAYANGNFYGRAFKAFYRSWKLSEKASTTSGSSLADEALSRLANLYVNVGAIQAVSSLLPERQRRELRGSARGRLESAIQHLHGLQTRPDHGYNCGGTALNAFAKALNSNAQTSAELVDPPEGTIGYTLADLKLLGNKNGLAMKVSFRNRGQVFPIPSIVHWKVGHYSTLIERKGALYLERDGNFGHDRWISEQALDEEASGYFLTTGKQLPKSWVETKDADNRTIWGGCHPSGEDPDHCDDCQKGTAGGGSGGAVAGGGGGCASCVKIGAHPMAEYSIQYALANLHIFDTPISYDTPFGPDVAVQVTYNHRDAAQPATFNYSNFGRLWTFNWLSYVTDNNNASTDPSVAIYLRGGGVRRFTFTSGATVSSANPEDYTVLSRLSTSPVRYERLFPDGGKEIYTFTNTGAPAGSPRKIFLTQLVDPAGNAVTITYNSNFTINQIIDANNQATTFTYGNSSDVYKITKITDPFGRFASFAYTTTGQLFTITDPVNIVSKFGYINNGTLINSLATPYGTTTFNYQDSLLGTTPYYRSMVEAVDPLGGRERVEQVLGDEVDTIPSGENQVPAGINAFNQNINTRATFYWSKKAMMDAPGDYSKAYQFHYVNDYYNVTVMGDVLESEKAPLENRVWYNYPGQSPGTAYIAGTSSLPSIQARVLDDGTTQATLYEYNAQGSPTKITDPLGRETKYTYYGNGVDLYKVMQRNGTVYDLLKTFGTYNSQHLPLNVTDAAGQVTSYTYTSLGQISTITRTRNGQSEIVTYTYYSADATGTGGTVTNQRKNRLQKIDGPLAGSADSVTFDYDAVGRLASKVDLSGDTTSYLYDNIDRVTQTTHPDLSTEVTTYSILDPEWTKDRNNRWTHNFHDPLRRLTAVTDPQNRTTKYDYCPCGALSGIKDGAGNSTGFLYDVQGRLQQKVYADATSLNYVYENTTSRLKNVTDAKNQRTNYTYYLDNALNTVTYTDTGGAALVPPTAGVTYSYDSSYKRLSTLADGTGSTGFVYYPVQAGQLGAGQLQLVDGPWSGTVDQIVYTYDEYGRKVSSGINGTLTAWTFDGLGRSATYSDSTGAYTYAYVGVTNRVDYLDYPNNQRVSMSYFDQAQDRRLKQIKNLGVGSGGTGAMISQFDYDYDAIGNIKTWDQRNNGGGNPIRWTIGQDGADQLTDVAQTDLTTGTPINQYHYGYDSVGNRIQEQVGTAVGGATYNYLNQLTSLSGSGPLTITGTVNKPSTVTVNGQAVSVNGSNQFSATLLGAQPGPTTVPITAKDANNNITNKTAQINVTAGVASVPAITYDLNGNMTNDGSRSYEWDAINRLVAINYLGTSPLKRSEFSYNGIGQRIEQVEKTGGGIDSDIRLLWDGLTLRQEHNSTSYLVNKRYGRFGLYIVAGNATGSFYYFRDHLGSIREMTDGVGNIRARYGYDTWGKKLKINGDMDCDFGYTGHAVHPPSALNFTFYRVYSASYGRWLSRDPLQEQGGVNLYSYVKGKTIGYVDPDGRELVGALIGGAVGAIAGGISGGWPGFFGGAVGGIVGGLTFNPALGALAAGLVSGAVGGATGDLVKQGLQNLSGCKSGIDGKELLYSTLGGAAFGGGLGAVLGVAARSAGFPPIGSLSAPDQIATDAAAGIMGDAGGSAGQSMSDD